MNPGLRIVPAVLLLACLPLPLISQPVRLIVKDKATDLPVTHVVYMCDDSKGYTGDYGELHFTPQESSVLMLSHISYNLLVLKGEDLQKAIKSGYVELEYSSPVLLNPVTVYAAREKKVSESILLENADWVHHDAGQVLQQIPGFDAVRKSIFGYDPVFRGFRLDQINIINDGALRATAACPNRMDPPSSQIAINQVSEIEVIRGPHSFRYGPSIGASVNFKTAPPVFTDTLRSFGRINSGFESNGSVYRNEGQIGIRNKRIDASLSGSYTKGGDYKDGGGVVIPAGLSRGTIGLTGAFQASQNKVISFNVNRNFARNTSFPTLPMDLLSDDTWMLHSKYRVDGTGKWFSAWSSQVYASFVDHLMSNSLRNPAAVLATTHANTRNIGTRTEMSVQRGRSLLYLGLDGKYENIRGNRSRSMLQGVNEGKVMTDQVWQDGTLVQGGAFADWLRQAGRFKLSFSSRLDIVNGTALAPAESFKLIYPDVSGTDFNLSISAGASRQWTSEWFSGLWIGRGLRSANITERFINSLPVGKDPYEMLGNPLLKPEANNQADILISCKKTNSVFEFSSFYSIVDGYISSVINPDISPRFGAPGVRQYINIKKAGLYGFEFIWKQTLLAYLNSRFMASYTHGRNISSATPLPEICPMNIQYSIEGNFLKDRVKPFIAVRHSSAQNRIAADFGEVKTAAFTIFDTGLRFIVLRRVQSSVAVNNLTNRQYREHLSRFLTSGKPMNSVGRSVIANLTYSF